MKFKKSLKFVIETESGCPIKVMRFDQSEEFTSKEFQEFCEVNGIRYPLTIPDPPNKMT